MICKYYGCRRLTSFTIPQSLTRIEEHTFENCYGLTTITIPDSMTSIGVRAFKNCGLTTIIIPNCVKSIGKEAFEGCSHLTSITSLIGKPFYIYKKTFDEEVYHNATLYVPIGSKEKYMVTDGWKNFWYIEEGDYCYIPKYKLTYLLDGEVYKSYEMEEGSSISPEPTPSKDGYTFSGWSEIPQTMPDHDVTVTGSFTLIPISNEVDIDGFNYQFDSQTLTATVIPGGKDYSGEVVIPSQITYNGSVYSVTKIDGFAFFKCSGITSLTIPSSVKSIGSSAFKDCTGLTSLTLNEGQETIGGSAFESCTALKTLTIPSTVSSILINAFKNCKGLTDVYSLAESVPSTSDEAFNETPTESMTLHVPVTALDAYKATLPWSGFKSIVAIGSAGVEGISVQSTGGAIMQTNDLIKYGSQLNWSFTNNSNANVTLLSMQLIDGVTKEEGNVMSVDQLVESGSTVSYSTTIGLLGIHVPVTCRFRYSYEGSEYSIDAVYTGSDPISNIKLSIMATGNGTVTYNGTSIRNNNESFSIRFGGDATISFTPDEGYYIKYVKVNNSDVTSRLSNNQYRINLIMENTTVEVEFEAISNEVVLDNIKYQLDSQTKTATVISGGNDLSGEVVIPSRFFIKEEFYNVTSIGEQAFHRNSAITSVTIPNSVISIGEIAFGACENLSSITIPNSVTEIGDGAFYGCSALKNINLPSGLTKIGESMFWGCTSLTSVNIPEGVTTIAKEAFRECSVLSSITIPNSVTEIDNFAFYRCRGITSMAIPSGVKSIGSSALEDCTSLTSLTLNEGLETIGGSAFEGCTGLKTLTIPSTVKSILLNAIKNCTNLTEVYCLAENVPDTDDNAFDGTPTEKSTLHVPANAIDAYKSTWPWSDFKEIVALETDGINDIKAEATDADIYSVNGYRTSKLQRGLNIIRQSDGKVRKVLVR